MALSERTINKHNIKRAEVFKEHGLNTLDVQYAHPHFEHYAQSEQDCVLCGHRHIKWLFSIKFDAPQGLVALAKVGSGIDREGEVILSYVGSKCIQDWLDAVPETPEKLEALKRWHSEMERCKGAMKAKVVEDLCREAGYESPEEAYAVYHSLSTQSLFSLDRRTQRQLSNNGYGVKNKRSSRGTVKIWLENLAKALYFESLRFAPMPRRISSPVSASAPATVPAKSPSEDEKLLNRGRAAWSNKGALSERHRRAFVSMARQVARFGRFVSPAQRSFYTDLLKKMEQSE